MEETAASLAAREAVCDDRDADLRRREETMLAERDKTVAAIKALLA